MNITSELNRIRKEEQFIRNQRQRDAYAKRKEEGRNKQLTPKEMHKKPGRKIIDSGISKELEQEFTKIHDAFSGTSKEERTDIDNWYNLNRHIVDKNYDEWYKINEKKIIQKCKAFCSSKKEELDILAVKIDNERDNKQQYVSQKKNEIFNELVKSTKRIEHVIFIE